MVLGAPEAQDADFGGWKVLIGGSALSRTLCEAALSRNIDIYCGYGMSESCPLLTLAQIKSDTIDALQGSERIDREIDIRMTPGMPILLAQVRIVDEQMQPVPADGHSAGEVVVRTPYLTQSYFKNEEAGTKLWHGGWMHTGDIGRFDEEGYLHLLDRQKDIIKSGGEWISSIEVENLITQHPAVQEVAVIGVVDAKWGERPLAMVVLRPGVELTAQALREDLMARARGGAISPYAVPERYEFVNEIPKTSVGKLDKKRLREMHVPNSN
jgi:fatty-acyl-CoA synthase